MCVLLLCFESRLYVPLPWGRCSDIFLRHVCKRLVLHLVSSLAVLVVVKAEMTAVALPAFNAALVSLCIRLVQFGLQEALCKVTHFVVTVGLQRSSVYSIHVLWASI